MTLVACPVEIVDFRRPVGQPPGWRCGGYAGLGRYAPRDTNALSLQLTRAVGKFIHLELAGIAGTGQPYTGQRLYRECRGTAVLAGSWVPEQDLQFPD